RQQYEGAHNLHGRWSLPAYQQVASQLALALQSGQVLEASLVYDDWRGKSTERQLPLLSPSNGDSLWVAAVDAVSLSCRSCRPGKTVSPTSLAADPGLHFGMNTNFLEVQRRTNDGWQTVLTDTDWSTRFRWRFDGGAAEVTIEWDISASTGPGIYRLRHLGIVEQGRPFVGITENFAIPPR
ncbi:MAG: neutral/alkaline non-lysosomal ceramidase C-terminal domain-containing protein, partial [Halioglobus sp.]|nr:neutral/alkaline non-lysosomal ceramidase C-terminal domain-containing protein [Halioglobus sp.]